MNIYISALVRVTNSNQMNTSPVESFTGNAASH